MDYFVDRTAVVSERLIDPVLLRLLEEGKFVDGLNSESIKEIWRDAGPPGRTSPEEWITQCVQEYLVEDSSPHRQWTVLYAAVCHLQYFVQCNWTGPPTLPGSDPLNTVPGLNSEQTRDLAVSSLSVDGMAIYNLVQHPTCLWMARILLTCVRDKLHDVQTVGLCLLRCLTIQQQLLEDRSPTLKSLITVEISEMSELLSVPQTIQFHLEAGYISYFYYEYGESEKHFQRMKTLVALEIELTGAMGKRTRFQQEAVAQLYLSVKRTQEASDHTGQCPTVCDSGHLPTDLALDDDTVLNDIAFTDSVDVIQLSPLEQACVLGEWFLHKKSRPVDEPLIQDETRSFIQPVLKQPQDWAIHLKTLYERCRNEKESGRRVERATMQLEELVGRYNCPEPNASLRQGYIHCCNVPPKFEVKNEYGRVLRSLGSTKAALEVFLSLESWEDIISCYQGLGRTGQAEKVIRERLEAAETPDLWCHLGDVTRDPDYYRTAWTLSKQRCSRAMKNLGYHHMVDKQYEQCLDCFEKSLALNSMQVGVWFSYGCAGMVSEKFDAAVKGFRACVNLDTENFEAWNNLASCFIKQKKKHKAFNIYHEALKRSYDNWKIWENYMLISTDCGEFREVIRAYHRLLDIKGKWTDAEVLGILTRAACEGLPDGSGRSTTPIRPRLLELLGRVTSTVTSDADIWRHYATLILSDEDVLQDKVEQALQYLMKSHRCLTQTSGWERDIQKCLRVAEMSLHLGEVYTNWVSKICNSELVVQHLNGAKLVLKGDVAKIQKYHADTTSKEIHDKELKQSVENIENKLREIIGLIENHGAQTAT